MRMYPETSTIGSEAITVVAGYKEYVVKAGDKQDMAIWVKGTFAAGAPQVAISVAEGIEDEKGVIWYSALATILAATAITTEVPIRKEVSIVTCQWLKVRVTVTVNDIATVNTYFCSRKVG